MPDSYWPLFDLRLSIADLELRPMTENDARAVADVMPLDFKLDPRLPEYGITEPRAARAANLFQAYWRSMAEWRPQSWSVQFVVRRRDQIVAVQELEGPDFDPLRTVETASWVMTEERGHGVGKAMRVAVLALAFDHLGAEAAETEAWPANQASLGVSRALSYVDNGVYRHREDDGPGSADMVRMRMPRAVWEQRHRDHGVVVAGFAECRHLFGR
jgi:RimJ/RimL family protein N-acetyltransferase